MNSRSALALVAALTFALTGTSIAATQIESHAKIRSVAEAHALQLARSFAPNGAKIDVRAATLDPRLALPACATPLQAFDAPTRQQGAHLSIGVRCAASSVSSRSWSLYVPVQVKMLARVVVLAVAVPRGHALARSDLRLETRDVATLTGSYLSSIDKAAGMVLARSVRPGTALSSRLLDLPTLVHRGQQVRLIAKAAGFVVQGAGEALSDASAGDRVRVRNPRSKRIVEGTVDAQGRVHTQS